jgi:hypothetical protein
MGIRRFEFLTNTSGQNEKDGVFRIAPDSAEYTQNLHYTKNGTFSAYNQGYDEFSEELESGADIDSIGAFTDDTGNEFMLVATNGTIHSVDIEDGSDNGSISSAPTAGAPVDFQTFKGSVYMVDGTITPIVWTGSGSASTVSGLPKTVGGDTYDKPKIVEKFNNRLVYGNFQDASSGPYPSHIAISNTLAPDTFTTTTTNATDGFVAQVSPGDGQELRALKALYLPQQNEEVLLCFKDHSTYVLTGSTPSDFAITLLSATYGCLSNKCAIQVGNDIIFMDERNIYSMSTATESGNIQRNIIGSDNVAQHLQRINLDARDKAWVEHISERFEVWFAFPTGSSTEVDTILVYNYRNADQGQHIWTTRTNMTARCGLYNNGRFFTGNTDGIVDEWFGVSSYRGVGYNWVYRYPYYNFEDQTRVKRILGANVIFNMRGSETITLKYEWVLGGNNARQSYSRTKTLTSGSSYGSAVYGSSVYAISGGLLRHEPFQVLGNGLMWQFECSGTTGTVAPDFLGVYGHLDIGDFNRSSV